MTNVSRQSPKGVFLRMGFTDPDRAVANLERLGDPGRSLLSLLGATADPDQALSRLTDLTDRDASTESRTTAARSAARRSGR